ncbi:MAG: OmpH family outer membrane protein, partial [Planctomycetota bacterium]
MLQKFWIAIVSLLVFLLLLDRVTPLRGAPKALREMKIGVVDFSRVAKKYSKYKRVKRRLDFEEKRIKSELEGIKQEMEVLEKEIKMYNPQSDLYK